MYDIDNIDKNIVKIDRALNQAITSQHRFRPTLVVQVIEGVSMQDNSHTVHLAFDGEKAQTKQIRSTKPQF